MATTVVSTTSTTALRAKSDKLTISLSRKALFGSKSEEWHKLIDCMAGSLQPSDAKFPFKSLQGQTDYYLKKKGKMSQKDIDSRISALLEAHDDDRRHIALAACAHVMSPITLQENLNEEITVAPVTYQGLYIYLQSLIAIHRCNSRVVGALEAQLASNLISYTTTGTSAASSYLKGLCNALQTIHVPLLSPLPHLSSLTQRAFQDFALELRGYQLGSRWSSAHSLAGWMSRLIVSPRMVHPGYLLPEHLFDAHFPEWRPWALWRPDMKRISVLEKLDTELFYDLPALEGPDFITGRCATLVDGLVSGFGEKNTHIRFRSLTIQVPSHTKEELKDLLDRLSAALETATTEDPIPCIALLQLCVLRPVTPNTLRLLEGIMQVSGPSKDRIRDAVIGLWLNQGRVGGKGISAFKCLVSALNTDSNRVLETILLEPWFVEGLQACIRECQEVVHKQAGPLFLCPPKWLETVVPELHGFLEEVQQCAPILPLLDATIQKQLAALPTSATLGSVIEIQKSARRSLGQGSITRVSLVVKNSFLPWLVVNVGLGFVKFQPFETTQRWLGSILGVWTQTADRDRRTLAILCFRFLLEEPEWHKCVQQILWAPDDFVKTLIPLLTEENLTANPEICFSFTRLLKGVDDDEVVQSWKCILRKLLRDAPSDSLAYNPDLFTVSSWHGWIIDVRSLWLDDWKSSLVDTSAKPDDAVPSIFRLDFHTWIRTISTPDTIFYFLPTIDRLANVLKPNGTSAVRFLLERGDSPGGESCSSILSLLKTAQSCEPTERVASKIVGCLSSDGDNADQVESCLTHVLRASDDGLDACQQIVDSTEDGSIPSIVIEVLVAGWLEVDETCELTSYDRCAITATALVYGVPLHDYGIPKEKVEEAMDYFEQQEKELLQEANRLEGIKDAMKTRDPTGTSDFLKRIGYPDTSPIDQEFLELPAKIIDAVDRQGDNLVEISFPLTAFTELQRAATGIGQANALLVILRLGETRGKIKGSCIHLDTEAPTEVVLPGTSWNCFQNGTVPSARFELFCGPKKTLLTYHLARAVQKYIVTPQAVEIEKLHGFIEGQLKSYARFCVTCGAEVHSSPAIVVLRRPLFCFMCTSLHFYNNISLDIRFPEIRNDTFVVDMLLTGVFAAANNSQLDLLPGCPIDNKAQIISILNTLPALSVLQAARNISAVLKDYHPDAEKLLSWVCSYYRGFVASATGILKIHGLHTGTHQFVLANADPAMESEFAARILKSNSTTRVLFHGTSLDRLPNILAKGLQVLSGTALQRTGAAYGNGIYMAEDPSTSFGYSPSAISWPRSGLHNMRVLLGCEVVGDGNRVSSGVHVIKDEKTVMLRYIFLLPPGGYAPVANHVVTPILSAMTALRSRAV